jgi:hypothetical protein
MASSLSVPGEAACDIQFFVCHHRGREVFASQSWNWLTERIGRLPQVCLVFDDQSPQSAGSTGNFEGL